ncbi:restriction endonuclease subunit S [Streptomyces nojiriensis]|uniref:restriction endonuclease subunit S n=1 Tax=Streptomyces nojiriensis TaxID=66374 RepID=UPI00366703BF
MSTTPYPFPSGQPAVLAPIGAAFSVTLGKMLDAGRAVDDTHTTLPYVRAANIQDEGLRLTDVNEMPFSAAEARRLDLRKGDLLVVEGGAVGTCVVLDHDMPGWSFQKTVNRLRATNNWSTRYLAYVLRSYRDAGIIDLVCNGSTISHLTAEKLRALRVPAVQPETQRAIAEFLDRETAQIDALVSKQEEFIEFLRERRRAAIEVAVSEVRASGPRLKYLVRSVRQGWSPQCYSWPTDGISSWAVLKAGAANGGVFRPMENKELPAEETPRPEAVVKRGDLIVSRANTRDLVGSAAVVEGNFPRLMLSDKLYAFTLDEDQALPQFVAAVLGSRKWRDLVEMQATGASSSMLNISQSDIVNLPMSLPPVDEQHRILNHLADQTAGIDALIAKAQEHIAFAKERRAALITAAVTGQLDVRTARKAG